MPVKCAEIFRLVEEMASLRLAENWDNTGLQLGDPRSEVERVLLTLDVSLDVAAEAKEKGAGLIVSHHPMMLKPLKTVRLDQPEGELIACLIKNNITVYAAHTNLDIAAGGVSSALADRLELKEQAVLHQTGQDRYIKLAVFVPATHLENVRGAVLEAGAGHIGNYSHCSFMNTGTGTFMPMEGTNPYIGRTGKMEQVEEIKLETVVPVRGLSAVIQAMIKAHPYEEVAYDLYPLENTGLACGLGRVGILAQSLPFDRFVSKVKTALGLPAVRIGGRPESAVKKVAVCGGSGAELWPDAMLAGADTLVTGDIKYHVAQDMLTAGLKFVDAGHHGTEAAVMPVLHSYLAGRCREADMEVEILISQVNTDPFAFL